MTQTGVVTKLLDKGLAEVAVERVTACHHCSGCGECIYGKQIYVQAENKIYAKPGERVVLESATKVIMQVTLLIYMLPVALLFLGYAMGALLQKGQETCIITSAVGFAIGVMIAVEAGKHFKKIDYTITAYKR